MAVPRAKNLDKKALFVWDDTAQSFVAWDNGVRLFDQNNNGLDTQTDPSSSKNRLLAYSKIQSGDASEGDTLYVATEDGAMLSARGAVLLAGVDNLTTNIRQRLLQTEAIGLKNHLLVKDAFTSSIDSNLNRVVGTADDPAGQQSIIIGGVVDGKIGNSSGDYATLNVNKTAVLRVIPSTGSADAFVGKEASDTLGGANVMGVAAFQNSSNRAACPVLDSSGRVVVSATSVIPGTSSTALGKAEDTAHANGHTGIAVWAVRTDTASVSAGTNGDYATINEDSNGQLYATLGASTGVIGLDTLFDADADNTAQSLKASAGKLYSIHAMNINNVDAFIQFFDLATGSVTVGTTTPKFVLHIPKGDATNYGHIDKEFVIPVDFATAITYAVTTTPTGSGDPTVGITLSGFYK